MKKNILFSAIALFATSAFAADASPKDEVTAGAKKLGEKANYSWTATVTVHNDSQFRPGPTEGKTEKDGFIHVTSSFGENTTQTVLKGDKGALTNLEGAWQSLAEVEKEEGFGRFRAIAARALKAPAMEAAELAAFAQNLKKEGDVYSSDLTEKGAKTFLSFRRDAEDPAVSNAKVSVKFWIKDGVLTKYEYRAQGNIKFGDNDFPNDRTTTVEIKDVGTTKVSVPEEAKKKL